MPRRPTITKDEMVEAAFTLVRREGHAALTARSLAAELGCSTQPIMRQFPALSELRELVYERADAFHTTYILAGKDLLEIGERYIQFAAEEPALFRLLFQSGHFDGTSLQELIQAPAIAPLLTAVELETGAGDNTAAQQFEALFVAVHGYASLIANNAMPHDAAAIRETLVAIATGLERNGDQP